MIEKDINKLKDYSKIVIIGYEDSSLIRYLLNPIKSNYVKEVTTHIRTNKDMVDIDSRLKFKPFFHKEWLIVYSNQENKAPVKAHFNKILNHKSNTFRCMCYASYRTFKTKLANESWVKSPDVGIFNLMYLPVDFYKKIIFENIKQQIYNPALNLFLKYISRDSHNIMSYIDVLNTIDHPITVEDIKLNIDDTRVVNITDYISKLFQQKERTTIKTLTTLINNYGYKKFKKDLDISMSQLIALKKLMYSGQVMPETIFDDMFRLKNEGILPEEISKLNINTMRGYCLSIISIPLKHLILYSYILKKAVDETHLIVLSMLICNRAKWDKDDINYIKTLLEVNLVEDNG